jgi:tape measure domain-containing protein
MASGNMDDLRQQIFVDVDGTKANEAFKNIASSAQKADKAIDDLGKTVDRAEGKLKNGGDAAEKATSKFNDLQQSLFGVRGKAAFIWDLAIDGFRTAVGFAEQFIERTSAVQRTMSLLATIPGGGSSQDQFTYLTQVANNYGLSLRAIQDDYAKLNLAAQNTTMTSDQVRRVFEQVSMATRTLHLNAQQTQLTFLAVEQMLSKGKISMEELRKQFAERIPGAMQALARELGVTYPVLEKFITKMGAASDKIVPELGNAIQRLYQSAIPNAAAALDAEKNRLETSVAVFFKNVVEAGGTEGMSRLLRSINDLMQTDNVAAVFARAMNTITGNIANFLSTLKPEDVDHFANSVLDFLSAFASLAMAAGRAVVFLSQHLPQVAAAFGAFMGATIGAPLGPWGAAIGLIVGAGAGYAGAKSIQGSAMGGGDMAANMQKMQELDDAVAKAQKRVDETKGNFFTGPLSSAGVAKNRLSETQKERDEFYKQIEPMMNAMVAAQSPRNIDSPTLGDQRNLVGDANAQLKWLHDHYGMTGQKTAAELAAERLAQRQQFFVESLQNKVDALKDPSEDKFDQYYTQARRLKIPENSEQWKTITSLVDQLQADYNKKQDDKSKAKTMEIERVFSNMEGAANNDIAKFRDRYDTENLKQVDDADWATKARKMGNQNSTRRCSSRGKSGTSSPETILSSTSVSIARSARLKRCARSATRTSKSSSESKAERKTIQGGAKQWLATTIAVRTDYGKITYQFMDGIKTNIEDMLFNFVKTGKLSFAQLGQFVIDYLIKVKIAQAMTPAMNQAGDWITKGLGMIMGATIGDGSPGAGFGSDSELLNYVQSHRANGGPVQAGTSYLVGERGMEVFTPNSDGYIHPNESIRSGGSGDVNVQVNIDGGGGVQATGAGDLGRRIGQAVRAIIVDEKRPGGMLA